MVAFRYVSPDEVAARHRARTPVAPLRQTNPVPVQRNVEVVLSLGDVRYITFRSRVYRIPPVPFKLGQRVLHCQTKVLMHARLVATGGQQQSMDAYYGEMSELVKLLWRHIRPTGKIRRALWRMNLMQNPFRQASEQEVRAVTDFFLQGRMTSSVQLTKATGTQP